MKDKSVAGYLHVERKIRPEPMVPIELETKEVVVEFAGLLDGKHAKNRDNAVEGNGHRVLRRPASLC
jgi:hypothetical protein